MTRRMIDASLWQNEKFTRMPLGAQMLQIGIITHADEPRRYALPDDITELAAAIKARYSAGDIATLVAELVAIPY